MLSFQSKLELQQRITSSRLRAQGGQDARAPSQLKVFSCMTM